MDNDNAWTTLEDAIHLEDPNGSCPTGMRDLLHNTGSVDCVVLDEGGNLENNEIVDCDLETVTLCTGAQFVYLQTTGFKFTDIINQNGRYDNTEDIIIDVNGDGIFN